MQVQKETFAFSFSITGIGVESRSRADEKRARLGLSARAARPEAIFSTLHLPHFKISIFLSQRLLRGSNLRTERPELRHFHKLPDYATTVYSSDTLFLSIQIALQC